VVRDPHRSPVSGRRDTRRFVWRDSGSGVRGPPGLSCLSAVARTARRWKRNSESKGPPGFRAHGYTPVWTAQNKLGAESRAALKVIDLHFHDLRHEAGSRLIEGGWPLHHVQHMLGHANVSQTSTCLSATRLGLQESMRRMDLSAPNLERASSASTPEQHVPLTINYRRARAGTVTV